MYVTIDFPSLRYRHIHFPSVNILNNDCHQCGSTFQVLYWVLKLQPNYVQNAHYCNYGGNLEYIMEITRIILSGDKQSVSTLLFV